MTLPTRTRNLLMAFALAAILPSSVPAEDGPAPDRKDPETAGFKVTPKKPVEVESDELTFNRAEGLTVFKGKVKVNHDKMVMGADELRALSGNRQATAEGGVTVVDGSMAATLSCGHLDYRDQMRIISAHDKPRLTTVDNQGDPVTLDGRQMEFYSDQKMAVANQDVKLAHPKGNATAGKATFLKGENRVILEEGPRVFNDFGDVTGRRLTAYLGTHRLVAEGDVTANFFPTPQPGGARAVNGAPVPDGSTAPLHPHPLYKPRDDAQASGTPVPTPTPTAPGKMDDSVTLQSPQSPPRPSAAFSPVNGKGWAK